MMCDECGIRPATIRLMSIINGEKIARNLCANCLAEVKKQLPELDLFSPEGLFASLLAAAKQIDRPRQPEIEITCPNCGTTYEQYQKSGLLGCAECYTAFREPLEALLLRIHGQTRHTGRVPGAPRDGVATKHNVAELKRRLAVAIQTEEYEQAAAIRDEIRALDERAEPAKEV